jgi:hypothetical protein
MSTSDENRDVIDDFLELQCTKANEAMFSLQRIARKYTVTLGIWVNVGGPLAAVLTDFGIRRTVLTSPHQSRFDFTKMALHILADWENKWLSSMWLPISWRAIDLLLILALLFLQLPLIDNRMIEVYGESITPQIWQYDFRNSPSRFDRVLPS